ncbi:UNVERIFIED_CONTAM: LEC14B protein [Sesamum radiatum]|uniref:LEC14B protein n=1 Tax=Sesamum radiatum TaxID=300843 RepID=A0AAW2W7G2_SESRA
MLFVTEDVQYAFSVLGIESGDDSSTEETGGSPWLGRKLDFSELDIAQLIKLRSGSQENLSRVLPGRRQFPISTTKMLAGREANLSGRGRFSSGDCRHVLSKYLPVHGPWVVDQMSTRAYVSQFFADGSLFVAAFQVYASMSPVIHIVNAGSATGESLANITEIHDGLDFTSPDDQGYTFGIFSVKFSTDGREVVAGSSSGGLCVYDLEAKKLSLRISAHMSDVNTVCFADESGNLIYSGSDDGFCKVWDRRCFTAQGKPVGILVGHLQGITFVDSRGDGRFRGYGGYEWDYRWMEYPLHATKLQHPYDQSVATYKGHSVLRTLIRCYFSPESTGQKYIYTGSHDSCIYIYDLISGAQVAKLQYHRSTVRDCSWHPNYPILVSSSWDGELVKWEFPGKGLVSPPANDNGRQRRHVYDVEHTDV